MKKEKTSENSENNKKGKYLSQSDVPSMPLEKSISIAKTIVDNYASKPATPLQVARALDVTPTSGPFKMLCGASIAYGLTKGGYNAEKIELLPLAIRILKPKLENDDSKAKVEAFLKPRVLSEFVEKYKGSPIPRDDIAKNVLEEMGVPKEKLDYVLEMIVEEGTKLGIITSLKGKKYVEIPTSYENDQKLAREEGTNDEISEETNDEGENEGASSTNAPPTDIYDSSGRSKKVFITHGKNKAFVDPIKKLLKFGEMEAVVSVEKTSVSVPVPDKVMNDMRSCGAAIIHVEDELNLIDKDAKEYTVLNPNVLIEIGAAMALFGRRFILLVKDGVKLPSNLQGLFEVRYTGDTLDGDATIRLLEAINDIKNQKLPN